MTTGETLDTELEVRTVVRKWFKVVDLNMYCSTDTARDVGDLLGGPAHHQQRALNAMFRSFLLPSSQSLGGGLHVEVLGRVSESADQVSAFHPQLKSAAVKLGHEDIRHHPPSEGVRKLGMQRLALTKLTDAARQQPT